MAGILLASTLVQLVLERTIEGGAPLNAYRSWVDYALERAIPAFMLGVLGGAVQYLADIRWALLRRLESNNA